MNRKLVLCLLPVLILACGMAAPITPTETPEGVNTIIPVNTSEPLDAVVTCLEAEGCTLVAITDANARSCASVSCETVGWIYEGEIITAACNDLWAYVPRRGWVCVPAMTGNGGCDE